MLSYVWFDLGYTLVYMQRESTYRRALQHFGVDVGLEDLKREFHLLDKLFMREFPGVFLKPRAAYMPWYLGMLNHRMGITVDLCAADAKWEEIKKETQPYWLPYEETERVLAALKRESIGLGVISNWDQTARDVLRTAGLEEFFDHIVISSEVGQQKPDRAIFHTALAQAGVTPEECFYVGDNYYDDALGCREVGMRPLIVNRFGRLGIEEVRDCPVITCLTQILDHVDPCKTRGAGQSSD
jgi:putative hydrolase of the HAD superfamily